MKVWEKCFKKAADEMVKQLREEYEQFVATGNCGALLCIYCPFHGEECTKNNREKAMKLLNEDA